MLKHEARLCVNFGRYMGQMTVNSGQDHDTAEFAVASLKRWWEQAGRVMYASAKYLMITVDSGGSNGYRLNQFKWELQQFANETGLKIFVCHFPPGTSKWNKIEHNLFCYISKNWAANLARALVTAVCSIRCNKTGRSHVL